jgi:hypothetical protein
MLLWMSQNFWLIHDNGWTHTVCQPRCCEYSLNWAPDDGRGLRPKHVERLTGNNKVLYKVSSRWNFFKIVPDFLHQLLESHLRLWSNEL